MSVLHAPGVVDTSQVGMVKPWASKVDQKSTLVFGNNPWARFTHGPLVTDQNGMTDFGCTYDTGLHQLA